VPATIIGNRADFPAVDDRIAKTFLPLCASFAGSFPFSAVDIYAMLGVHNRKARARRIFITQNGNLIDAIHQMRIFSVAQGQDNQSATRQLSGRG
jgi:hypothetical protein